MLAFGSDELKGQFMRRLLLDEVAAHLDRARRKSLLEALAALGSQSWMTGTDAQLFEAMVETGVIFHVEDGRISQAMED